MKDAQGAQVLGGTRWKRFGLVMVPTVVAAATLTVLMGKGAIASSFAVSGSRFEVSADQLTGYGFAQYGTIDNGAGSNGSGSAAHPVAVSGIASATITNLCQSVTIPHTPLGTLVLRITAGTGSTPVKASNLLVDADTLQGNATFENIAIGQDASTLTKGGPDAKGMLGTFGQQADKVVITNLRQTAWATTAGTFQLSGLNLAIGTGQKQCF
jgi:hypothetical protein